MEAEKTVRAKIEQELLNLGAPTGRLGYIQMACALEIIIKEDQVISTTRVLYPMIATLCNTKSARIERNIREEIRAIWIYGNQKRLNQLFINRETCPPGNKEFLYTIARRLQNETHSGQGFRDF
ncbi:MAG: sporulation initiation factor Spo0A C-terminal domain-containing protein [Clostridia bacterium]